MKSAIYSAAVALLLAMEGSRAAFNQVSQGVVRIDLEKKYIPRYEVTELEEEEDDTADILIEDMTYAQLRAYSRVR